MKVGDLVTYKFFVPRGLGIIVAIDEQYINPVDVFWIDTQTRGEYPFGDLEVVNENR